MSLDLTLAADFLVLAEASSYAQAATRLTMTPSALSKRVYRLEHQVGVPLVQRPALGPVVLTRAGVRFAGAVLPLLQQAEWAKQQTVAAARPSVVRVGFPSGAPMLLQSLGFREIAARARKALPLLRLRGRDVPFDELDQCLPDGRVDVLITSAPVSHATVESMPLPFEAGRVLIVNPTHSMADAGQLSAEDIVDTRMLHNPAAPSGWMRPFWFGDIRPYRQAQLVETDSADHFGVMKRLTGHAEVAMGSVDIGTSGLGDAVRIVKISGVPPIVLHAARRSSDHRDGVEIILSELRSAEVRQLV